MSPVVPAAPQLVLRRKPDDVLHRMELRFHERMMFCMDRVNSARTFELQEWWEASAVYHAAGGNACRAEMARRHDEASWG